MRKRPEIVCLSQWDDFRRLWEEYKYLLVGRRARVEQIKRHGMTKGYHMIYPGHKSDHSSSQLYQIQKLSWTTLSSTWPIRSSNAVCVTQPKTSKTWSILAQSPGCSLQNWTNAMSGLFSLVLFTDIFMCIETYRELEMVMQHLTTFTSHILNN